MVFGMPGEAIKADAVDTVLPISEIPAEIVRAVNYSINREKT